MLILARKVNERIIIGDPGDDQIELAVVEIRGDQVKLGIQAPKHIKVYRREVYAAIQQENVAAAGARPEHVPELPELPALDPDRQRGSATGDAGGGS